MWDLIVSVPDHCLSFYFVIYQGRLSIKDRVPFHVSSCHPSLINVSSNMQGQRPFQDLAV